MPRALPCRAGRHKPAGPNVPGAVVPNPRSQAGWWPQLPRRPGRRNPHSAHTGRQGRNRQVMDADLSPHQAIHFAQKLAQHSLFNARSPGTVHGARGSQAVNLKEQRMIGVRTRRTKPCLTRQSAASNPQGFPLTVQGQQNTVLCGWLASSKKTMDGEAALARENKAATAFSLSPTHLENSSGPCKHPVCVEHPQPRCTAHNGDSERTCQHRHQDRPAIANLYGKKIQPGLAGTSASQQGLAAARWAIQQHPPGGSGTHALEGIPVLERPLNSLAQCLETRDSGAANILTWAWSGRSAAECCSLRSSGIVAGPNSFATLDPVSMPIELLTKPRPPPARE